ncbi:hypothetical protein DFH94DRAFT_215551 [Russula ochroleuca]|uniref:Uncharacterized protein n=1 Tax=Russula ochroleuca TaxID=152965 RepID=A0A9P5JX88_9AGAM|nr:hypothetical protein DFH94DRAFT_215551 [Russula ochroleuca]
MGIMWIIASIIMIHICGRARGSKCPGLNEGEPERRVTYADLPKNGCGVPGEREHGTILSFVLGSYCRPMHPSPAQPPHTPSQTYDVPIKTEERVRPIPALQQQPQRVQRYKDKFQALRERYESVISSHTEHTRAVQRATEKEQRLQAEINMLLDAALATSPQSQSASTPIPAATATATQSTTTTATTPTPTPVHAQLSPLEPHAVPVPPVVPAAHMNGHSSSVAPPHVHTHAYLHGHAYGANHTPPAPGSTTESDWGGGTTTFKGAEYYATPASTDTPVPVSPCTKVGTKVGTERGSHSFVTFCAVK